MEGSQAILPCSSLNKPKTALLKTTALTLTVHYHSPPLNTELNHCTQTCHSWQQLPPVLPCLSSKPGRSLVGFKSCFQMQLMNFMGCLKNATILKDGWNLPWKQRPTCRRLLPVASNKSHHLPPQGQVGPYQTSTKTSLSVPSCSDREPNRSCTCPVWLCTAKDLTNQGHNSYSSFSVSVLSNMAHKMHCLSDVICLPNPQEVLHHIKTHSYYILLSEAVRNIINTVDSSLWYSLD